MICCWAETKRHFGSEVIPEGASNIIEVFWSMSKPWPYLLGQPFFGSIAWHELSGQLIITWCCCMAKSQSNLSDLHARPGGLPPIPLQKVSTLSQAAISDASEGLWLHALDRQHHGSPSAAGKWDCIRKLIITGSKWVPPQTPTPHTHTHTIHEAQDTRRKMGPCLSRIGRSSTWPTAGISFVKGFERKGLGEKRKGVEFKY